MRSALPVMVVPPMIGRKSGRVTSVVDAESPTRPNSPPATQANGLTPTATTSTGIAIPIPRYTKAFFVFDLIRVSPCRTKLPPCVRVANCTPEELNHDIHEPAAWL